MTSLEEFLGLQRQAAKDYRAGNNQAAIDTQSLLVEQLLNLGAEAIQNQPKLEALLEKTSSQLVDALRWEREYDRAITLQDRLVLFFPEEKSMLQMGSANLQIEAGQAEQGILQIEELVQQDPNNFWAWVNLGAAYLWLENYQQAEKALKTAAGLTNERKQNRAIVYKYLFYLYAFQEQMDPALLAWNEACRLDPKQRQLATEIYRWLAYTHKFDEMQKLLYTETHRQKKLFYQGFYAIKQGNFIEANKGWKMLVTDFDPDQVGGAEDEYGEACIHLLNPTRAIMAMEPLVNKGRINYFRLVILGLAWAQKRGLEQARWYLDRAMRLADLERPRRTRPAPQGRILDIHARMIYGNVVIDQDIRQVLNPYFIPDKIEQP